MGKRNDMICTISLIVINVVVFFYLSFGGMTEDGYYMLEHGAMYVPYFLEEKEYYRIISCMFLHFGFDHLMNNMLTLGILGRYLEPAIGKAQFLAVYFISGLGGSALSIASEVFSGDYYISAGASGAIFGLTGALLCLTILNRGRIPAFTTQRMLLMAGISLYNGFVSEGVDNFAHLGGLFCGFLVIYTISLQQYRKDRSNTF